MASLRARNRQSISEAISISLGLQSQAELEMDSPIGRSKTSSVNPELASNYLGRSYVGSFTSPPLMVKDRSPPSDLASFKQERSQSIHKTVTLHRQTAAISNEFDDSFDNLDGPFGNDEGPTLDENVMGALDTDQYDGGLSVPPVSSLSLRDNESLHLLSPSHSRDLEYGALLPDSTQYVSLQAESSPQSHAGIVAGRTADGPLPFRVVHFMSRCVNYMPAVILGLLLNILDALSYGMIIFPVTEPVFSHLGPTGMSLFYVSSIVSQVVFSGGFSVFGNGIGSEMIEITPFYHAMAGSIMAALPGKDDEVITTTLVCYALSSILTGLTFFLLGKLRLGKIVGFFPRHILIGCIGGVGYFLVITGMEVSTRVAKFEYTWEFLSHLITDPSTLCKWLLPVALAAILVLIQHMFKNSLVLPTFYIATLLLFHVVVAALPNLSLDHLRDSGWIFPLAGSSENWYDFYRLYKFQNVHWLLVLKQVPTMLALTFFGILHVPINVPALAMSMGLDKFDVDKELIAHGYSNFFSGLIGSVQNYLVYTNSVLFIRAGADDNLAGYLLAAFTFVVMVIGPVIISFIPICIVGSLIFLLGYELIKEALFDTWGKLNRFEYITILIIVVTMGVFDFVLGIIVGILIACFSFLVDSTKLQTVNGEYDGQVARSTVCRDYIQTKFLNKIGEQIHVLKLQNILFFGTIISIEEKIDKLLEISDNDSTKQRIKYLILDFKNINADNIDYSAAEGFNRIKRFTMSKRITLIISSITEWDRIYSAFNKVGLLENVELFADLNSALEWCENELLMQYKQLRKKANVKTEQKRERDVSKNMMLPVSTPRNTQFVSVAQKIFSDEENVSNLRNHYRVEQPVLPLLLIALKRFRPQVMSNEKQIKESEEKLWSSLCKYMTKKRLAAQSLVPHHNNIFFLVESGMLKVTYNLHQGQLYEIMSSKTCFGMINGIAAELPESTVEIRTETDCVVWVLDVNNLAALQKENLISYTELLLVTMNMNQSRYRDLIGYCLVSS